MEKSKNKPKRKRGTVYKGRTYGWLFKIIFPITGYSLFISILTIVALLVSGEWYISPSFLVMTFLLVVFCWHAYEYAHGSELFISESGIEYMVLGVQTYVSWEQVGMFGWKHRARKSSWGILCNEPITYSRSIMSWLFGDGSYYYGIVPLELFEKVPRISWLNPEIDLARFQETPLGADLYFYAPHLFDQSDDQPEYGDKIKLKG